MNYTKYIKQQTGGGKARSNKSGAPTTDRIYTIGNTDPSQKSMKRIRRWDNTGELTNGLASKSRDE